MRISCFILLTFFIYIFSCILLSACSFASPAVKERFQELSQGYHKQKANGADLSRVDLLFPKIRQALKEKDWQNVMNLLDQFEEELKLAGRSTRDITTNLPKRDANVLIKSYFGLEYLAPGLADLYADTGAGWVKLPLVSWAILEPTPPKKEMHTYNWAPLDKVVKEWQKAGFNIQMVVKATSPWASRSIKKKLAIGAISAPPKEEHWKDYDAFIQNLVERYDKDGKEDLPGLYFPILFYEIESEAQTEFFWQGTIQDYNRLLKTAYLAAKRASPDVKIILSGINIGDLYDDNPPEELFMKRVESLPLKWRSYVEYALLFATETLKQKDYFDIVEFHAVYGYAGIPQTVAWLKREMEKNGYKKTIWAGDATSAPMLLTHPFDFNPPFPEKGKEYHQILGEKYHPRYDETYRWFLEEQARLTVKKTIISLASGVEMIMMGLTTDWLKEESDPYFKFQGLIDEHRNPRPAFYAYKLLIEKLNNYEKVETLSGYEKNIYAFRFDKGSKPFFILWSEGQQQKFVLDLKAIKRKGEIIQTTFPTMLREKEPKTSKFPIRDGKVELLISSTPVLIEIP